MRKMITNKYLERIIAHGSKIREMFESKNRALNEGKHPLDFSLGNPNIGPPKEYYAALEEILNKDKDHKPNENQHAYMSNEGYPETREKVALYMSKEYGIPFESKDIFMTVGAANAMDILMRTLIEPVELSKHKRKLDNLINRFDNLKSKNHAERLIKDFTEKLKKISNSLNRKDEIICIAPYFVEYNYYIRNNGGRNIIAYSDPNYDLDLNEISKKITKKTKAILLNSPNNPTGVVYSKEKLEGLAKLLKEKNKEFKTTISIIEDVPYSELVWNGNEFNSILPHYKNTFYATSFSKSLGIPGERIGFIAVHPRIGKDSADRETLFKALPIILRTKVVNAPALQQKIIGKIGCDVTSDIMQYKKRIDFLAEILRKNNFEFQMPQGTFYVWAKVPEIYKNADDFIKCAIQGNEPLFVAPGSTFGGEKYDKYVRFSASSVNEKDIKRLDPKLQEMAEKKSRKL